jgi:hypothetical protein
LWENGSHSEMRISGCDIHGPSGQNGGAAPKIVLEICTLLMVADDSDFCWI